MMERLTYKGQNGKNYVKDNGYYNGVRLSLDKTVDRLAAYEDTGLTPEEVDQIRKSAEYMMFAKVGDFVRYAISNFEDLQKYRKAENEGRLVVLPCKVGDTVYFQTDYYGRGIQEAEVKCLRIRADKNKVLFGADVEFYIVDPYYKDGRLMLCGAVVGIDNNFGNQPTAFLTREEAEQVLKGGAE